MIFSSRKQTTMILSLLFFVTLKVESSNFLKEYKRLLPKTEKRIMLNIEKETQLVAKGIEKIIQGKNRSQLKSLSITDLKSKDQLFLKALLENYRNSTREDIKTLTLHYLAKSFPPHHKKTTEKSLDILEDQTLILPNTAIFASKRFITTNQESSLHGQEVVVLYMTIEGKFMEYMICIRKNKDHLWEEFIGFDDFILSPVNKSIIPFLNSLQGKFIERKKLKSSLEKLSRKIKNLKKRGLSPDFKNL